MSQHLVQVERAALAWRAACSCGWSIGSPGLDGESTVSIAGLEHLEEQGSGTLRSAVHFSGF